MMNRLRLLAAFGLQGVVWALSLPAVADPSPAAETPAVAMTVVRPEPSDEVLFNPGMGLYLAGGAKFQPVPEGAWFLDIADIVYFRMNWSDIEPEENTDLDAYFGPIFAEWVGRAKRRVAFRVMSENVSSRAEYVTPKWVFDQGVPSVRHVSQAGTEQIDPVFWSPEYLEQCCRFVRRLGRYLDGREGLEFVDIGQIGEWGEMHLGQHIPNRWTTEQFEATGFSRSRYVAAYRQVIDTFVESFPHTRVFLNVGGHAEINEYAGIHGIHFRQDGLTPSGPTANVGQRFYVPWSRRGIQGNYEFHSGLEEMARRGWDLHATLVKGLEAPISYQNLNLASWKRLAEMPDDVRAELTETGRRIGFRFAPTEVRYWQRMRTRPNRPSRLRIEHTWHNGGVAPCYASYALRFSLDDASGRRVAEAIEFPIVPTAAWWPGEDVCLQSQVQFPAAIPPGDYVLKVGMCLPERPGCDIRLAIQGRDEQGQYRLGPIRVEAADDSARIVYEEHFEQGRGDWRPTKGMEADTVAGEGGGQVLSLQGHQDDVWSLAGTHQAIPVVPGGRYRLSCRMKVEMNEKRKAPSVKLGVIDADGKFLTNYNTNPYDLSRMGTWQEMKTTFESHDLAARGTLSLEKGGRHPIAECRVQLDDVVLELLESP